MGLKPDIKSRWIEALRSGKYSQSTGTLRDTNGYCCLGVLCDIVAGEIGTGWERRSNSYCFDGKPYSMLPQVVCNYVGEFPQVTLITMNDAQGTSFNEIADYIEKNL